MKIVAILVDSDYAICFQFGSTKVWEAVRLQGERTHCIEDRGILPILQEINELLNAEGELSDVHFCVLYADDAKHLKDSFSKTFQDFGCNRFEYRSLQTLCDSITPAVANDTLDTAHILSAKNDLWLKEFLLSLLLVKEKESSMQSNTIAVGDNSADVIASLRISLAKKEAEIENLRAQLNKVPLPNMEHLLTYLPMFYRNFFGTIRPDELALLAGTFRIPKIESPFPEPSADTVATLRQRFNQLPENERECVVNWCRSLTHRLSLRPEMRNLIEKKS